MLTEDLRRVIESAGHAYVASADSNCRPHLAAGTDPKILDSSHLVFESWCCHTTMENIAVNPKVAIAVATKADEKGFQFCGEVESAAYTAILDGYIPTSEQPETPQVQYRLVVRIDEIMEFSAGIHSDRPL